MAKKVISIVLVVVTILSTFAVSVNAAAYSTGKWAIASNSGSNIRTGPGTNYAKVGAASKNVTFTVSKVNGEWGYTSSIKCTNGTKSGWVNLRYCSYKGSSHTHDYNGGRYYQTAHPHEISVRCTSYSTCGGWKWTGENYKVSGCSQCSPHTHDYNGGRYYQTAHPHEISVRCTSYSTCGGKKYTGEYRKVSGCSQCSAHTHDYSGSRYYQTAHPHEISVRCTSYSTCGGKKYTGEYRKVSGCSQCSAHTHDYSGGRYYQTAHPHEISVRCTSYSSCGGWKWTGENYKVSGCSQCYPTVTCTITYNSNGGSGSPSVQKVKKNTSFALSGTIPTRSGYSFVGWSTSKSATDASFYPNQSVSTSGNVTLYAVWSSGSVKTSYSQPLTSGTSYYIEPACAPGSVFDVDGGNTYAGANLQIWQNAGVPNQQFKAYYYGSGYYYFVDTNSGLAIDVNSGVPYNGQNVHLYTLNKTDAQLFRLISAGNGYYYIQSKLNPSYYLDINGAYSSNGTNVHLYFGNSTSAQKFKFTAVSKASTDKYATYTGINYESTLKNALNSGKISTKEYNNRISVLNKAKDMVTVLWTSPVSFHTWKSSSGSYNSNKKMVYSGSASSTSTFVKGVTYKGIPYAANAGSNKYDDKAWLSLVKNNSSKSTFEGSVTYLGYTRSQCTSKGVDCSGFVYNAYKTLSSYTSDYLATSGLLNSSSWKKISASSAQPGDILLKSGHVMIYLGKLSNGKIAVFESTADGENGYSGCRYFEHSSVSGYGYYRFTNIAK